jgi:hypothetical protein
MAKYTDPKTKKKDAFFSGGTIDRVRAENIKRLTDKSMVTEDEARSIRGSFKRRKKRKESRY